MNATSCNDRSAKSTAYANGNNLTHAKSKVAQVSKTTSKRLDRSRLLDDNNTEPVEIKHKSISPVAEEVKQLLNKERVDYVVRPYINGQQPYTVATNGTTAITPAELAKLEEDQSMRYASHIKARTSKYRNLIIPVLPRLLSQVKHP